jgi:hypothetical protein
MFDLWGNRIDLAFSSISEEMVGLQNFFMSVEFCEQVFSATEPIKAFYLVPSLSTPTVLQFPLPSYFPLDFSSLSAKVILALEVSNAHR